MKRVIACMLGTMIVALSLIVSYAQGTVESKPTTAQAGGDAEVQGFLQKYAEVYNKHDARALADFWAAQAVSTDAGTGDQVTGRDAIRADFEATFKANPKSHLGVRLKNHRFIKPDVLSLCGEVTITGEDEDDNTVAAFSALLVKQGDKWLIEEATETPLATPATAYDGLKELAWLIGSWKDDVEGIDVTSEIKWSESKNFLLRKYTIATHDGSEPQAGTQIIAWDARSKSIRSWTFSSDGSFGEGAWSQSGPDWHVKFNHTQADGSLLSGLQILTKTDADTVTVQMIGQEEDGEPQPNSPAIKMVRQAAAVSK